MEIALNWLFAEEATRILPKSKRSSITKLINCTIKCSQNFQFKSAWCQCICKVSHPWAKSRCNNLNFVAIFGSDRTKEFNDIKRFILSKQMYLIYFFCKLHVVYCYTTPQRTKKEIEKHSTLNWNFPWIRKLISHPWETNLDPHTCLDRIGHKSQNYFLVSFWLKLPRTISKLGIRAYISKFLQMASIFWIQTTLSFWNDLSLNGPQFPKKTIFRI